MAKQENLKALQNKRARASSLAGDAQKKLTALKAERAQEKTLLETLTSELEKLTRSKVAMQAAHTVNATAWEKVKAKHNEISNKIETLKSERIELQLMTGEYKSDLKKLNDHKNNLLTAIDTSIKDKTVEIDGQKINHFEKDTKSLDNAKQEHKGLEEKLKTVTFQQTPQINEAIANGFITQIKNPVVRLFARVFGGINFLFNKSKADHKIHIDALKKPIKDVEYQLEQSQSNLNELENNYNQKYNALLKDQKELEEIANVISVYEADNTADYLSSEKRIKEINGELSLLNEKLDPVKEIKNEYDVSTAKLAQQDLTISQKTTALSESQKKFNDSTEKYNQEVAKLSEQITDNTTEAQELDREINNISPSLELDTEEESESEESDIAEAYGQIKKPIEAVTTFRHILNIISDAAINFPGGLPPGLETLMQETSRLKSEIDSRFDKFSEQEIIDYVNINQLNLEEIVHDGIIGEKALPTSFLNDLKNKLDDAGYVDRGQVNLTTNKPIVYVSSEGDTQDYSEITSMLKELQDFLEGKTKKDTEMIQEYISEALINIDKLIKNNNTFYREGKPEDVETTATLMNDINQSIKKDLISWATEKKSKINDVKIKSKLKNTIRSTLEKYNIITPSDEFASAVTITTATTSEYIPAQTAAPHTKVFSEQLDAQTQLDARSDNQQSEPKEMEQELHNKLSTQLIKLKAIESLLDKTPRKKGFQFFRKPSSKREARAFNTNLSQLSEWVKEQIDSLETFQDQAKSSPKEINKLIDSQVTTLNRLSISGEFGQEGKGQLGKPFAEKVRATIEEALEATADAEEAPTQLP